MAVHLEHESRAEAAASTSLKALADMGFTRHGGFSTIPSAGLEREATPGKRSTKRFIFTTLLSQQLGFRQWLSPSLMPLHTQCC